MPHEPTDTPVHLLAEFSDDRALLACARQLTRDGHAAMDLFSPFCLEGTPAILGTRRSRIPAAMLLAGVLGGAGAYWLQWWSVAIAYPLRVSGMPLDSVPAFIPITFESVVLGACVVGFVLALALSGLPRLWHPLFDSDAFQRACRDRFFLALSCAASQGAALQRQLQEQGALQVEVLAGDPS